MYLIIDPYTVTMARSESNYGQMEGAKVGHYCYTWKRLRNPICNSGWNESHLKLCRSHTISKLKLIIITLVTKEINQSDRFE